MNKVSIIMNCFNGEKYLHEALSSVISQTYQNWELIFYDNQSTDESKNIFRSFNEKRFLYYYAETHTKLFKARNKAIEKATGDLIAFLDVDDYWSEIKLEKQCEKFNENKDLEFIFTKYIVVDESSNQIKSHQKEDLSKKTIEELITNYQVGLSTVMLKRNLIKKMNFSFNEEYNIIGDFDAFANLIMKVNFLYMNEDLSFYRWHNNNLSTKNHSQELDELEDWVKKRKNQVSENIIKHVKNKIYYLKGIDKIKKKNFFNSLKYIIFQKGSEKKIKLFMFLIYFKFFKLNK